MQMDLDEPMPAQPIASDGAKDTTQRLVLLKFGPYKN